MPKHNVIVVSKENNQDNALLKILEEKGVLCTIKAFTDITVLTPHNSYDKAQLKQIIDSANVSATTLSCEYEGIRYPAVLASAAEESYRNSELKL